MKTYNKTKTKHVDTYLGFGIVSLHNNRNGASFLSLLMECQNCHKNEVVRNHLQKISQKHLFLLNFENFSVTFCSKIIYLENFWTFTGKFSVSKSLFKEGASFQPDNILEKTPMRLFSWDFCDIFKNTFLVELLQVSASKISLSRKYLVFLVKL